MFAQRFEPPGVRDFRETDVSRPSLDKIQNISIPPFENVKPDVAPGGVSSSRVRNDHFDNQKNTFFTDSTKKQQRLKIASKWN